MQRLKGFFIWIEEVFNEELGINKQNVIRATFRFPLAIATIVFTATLIHFQVTLDVFLIVFWGAYVLPFWLIGIALFSEARNLPRGWELLLGVLTSVALFWYVLDSEVHVFIESLYAFPFFFLFMLTVPFMHKRGWSSFTAFHKQFWYHFGTIFGVSIVIYLLSNFICYALTNSSGGCFWFANRLIFFTLIPLWGVFIIPEVQQIRRYKR